MNQKYDKIYSENRGNSHSIPITIITVFRASPSVLSQWTHTHGTLITSSAIVLGVYAMPLASSSLGDRQRWQ